MNRYYERVTIVYDLDNESEEIRLSETSNHKFGQAFTCMKCEWFQYQCGFSFLGTAGRDAYLEVLYATELSQLKEGEIFTVSMEDFRKYFVRVEEVAF